MVGRVYVPVGCWEYGRGRVYGYPQIRLKLINLLGEELELELPVDTGFEGSLLLDRETYEFFAVGELPREAWRIYRTLAGPLPMRAARAVAVIGGEKREVLVETPVYGLGKRLVGRELLNSLTLVLDGPRGLSCLAEPTGGS